jgi:oligopeptide transport system ATP-binding protein
VSDVSFDIWRNDVLAIVGETGSGKSTIARTLLLSPRPDIGYVEFCGIDLATLPKKQLIALRRGMQIVFQDPTSSLNPKWTVARIVQDPLVIQKKGDRHERLTKTASVMKLVGLPIEKFGLRKPHQLSGGEIQRVAIARALVADPILIICDEGLSALDVIAQSKILALFERIRASLSTSFLLISHDLSIVESFADRIAVLYRGRLCEIGPTESVTKVPLHPYTASLVDASTKFQLGSELLRQGPEVATNAKNLTDTASGCVFQNQCHRARERCSNTTPVLRSVQRGTRVACHYPLGRNDRNESPRARAGD